MIWTNNEKFKQKQPDFLIAPYEVSLQNNTVKINVNEQIKPGTQSTKGLLLCGDIFFRIWDGQKKELICRFALNTSFIKNDNVCEFTKESVDPDSILNNNNYDPEFKIELYFEDECPKETCRPHQHLSALCKNCREKMKDEVEEWAIIQRIVDNHTDRMSLMGKIALKELSANDQKNYKMPRQQASLVGHKLNFNNVILGQDVV